MFKPIAVISLVLTAGSAGAQGYFDFSDIPGVGPEPTVQIDLNAAMLGFVTAAAGASGESEAADLLAGIEGVRVRVYEELEDPVAVTAFVDDTSEVLERDGWQRVVYVQDEDERVRIYLKADDNDISGMTLMVTDHGEAVFINILGRIRPEMLGHLANTMGFGDVIDGFAVGALGAPPAGRDESAADD